MGNYDARAAWRKYEEEKKKKHENRSTTTSSDSKSSNKEYDAKSAWRKYESEKSIGFDTLSDDLNAMNETLGGIYGGWQDAETMKNTRSSVEGMYNRLLSYEDYRSKYGSDDWTDLSELTSSYKGILDEWDVLSENYSYYKSADEFNLAVEKQKKKEEEAAKLDKEMREADLGAMEKEIADLEGYLEEATKLKKKSDKLESKASTAQYSSNMGINTSSYSLGAYNAKNEYEKYLKNLGYSSYEELEKDLSDKKKFARDAEVLQNEDKALNAEDFEKYSEVGAGLENPSYKEAQWSNIFGIKLGGKDIGNKLKFAKDNETDLLDDNKEGDIDPPVPIYYIYATEDEQRVYDYYLGQEAEGLIEKGAADKYLESILPKLKARHEDGVVANIDEFAHEHPVLGSAISIMYSLGGGVEHVADSINYAITGEMDSNFNARASSTIRSRVSQDVDWEIEALNGWDAFDFVYNTGMSMADSAAVMWMPGGSGAVVLGLSAAAQGVNDALDRGLDSKQAFWNGFYSGCFEMAFEKFSIGNFKAFKDMSVDGLKAGFKNLGKSMLVNASEETLTELANIAYDTIAHGDLSNYAIRVQELLDSNPNMTEAEAKRKVALELGGQVLEAGASGALMGFGFGTVGNARAVHNTKVTGQRIIANDKVGDVFNTASVQLSPEESSAYEAYTKYANKGVTAENAKNGQVGNLAHSLRADAVAVLNSKNATPEQKAQAEKVLADLGAYTQSTSLANADGEVKSAYMDKDSVKALIQSGLSGEKDSESYKIAKEYRAKLIGGKKLTEKEIARLSDAITKEEISETAKEAEERLKELGETKDIPEIAQAIAKRATGQRLTSAETALIENSEHGNNVIREFVSDVVLAPNEFAAKPENESNTELVEMTEGMSEADAKLFIEAYDGVTNLEEYAKSFNLVNDFVKENYDGKSTQDVILKNRGVLSPAQVNKIYKTAVVAPRLARQEAIDKIIAKHSGKISYKPRIDDSVIDYENNGTKGKVNWNSLNERQKEAITFIKGFAKVAGVNLKITYNGKYKGKDYNGYYDEETNTIVIDARAGFDLRYTKDAIIPTFSHELVHWAKAKSPVLYAELSEKVFDALKKKTGLTEIELIANEQERLKNKYGTEYSAEYARDEIIARACEDMLSMSEEGKRLFNSLSEKDQRTIVGKLKKFIQNIVDWVNEFLGQYESKTPEAKALRSFKEELAEISKAYDKMLMSAIEANKALETEGITGEALAKEITDAQLSEKETITQADIDALRSIGRKSINEFTSEDIKKAEPFARRMWSEIGTKSTFFRNWFGDWRASDENTVSTEIKKGDTRGQVKNSDTEWSIIISRQIHKETSHHGSNIAKNAVKYLPYIKSITENAVLFDSYISDKDNSLSVMYHKLYAYTEEFGYPALLKLTVEELVDEKTGNPIRRDYILHNIEEETISKRNRLSTPNHNETDSSVISISDLFNLVKTYDKEFNPKEASKVVNADGTPKVVYHGTNKNFNTFESRDGVYWFSESFDYAESMAEERDGNTVMQVYLNLQNPLHVKLPEGKFSDPTYEKPVIAKAKAEGYDGVVFETDTDNELVYDKFYVAFEKGQIKSATDNIGTFDKGNEDIRFSEKDYGRITADMSDAERTKILSKKSIVAPIYEGQADSLIKANSVNLNSEKISTVKNAIVRIGEEFGVIGNEIRIDDVEVVITPSRKNLKESLSKETTPTELARLLPVLKESVSKAIGVERHDNRYYFDSDTVYFENLLGGYVDGKEFVPVRFGLKHSKTGNTVLYVVVDQNRIPLGNLEQKNKTEVVNTAGPIKTEQTVSRSVEYSISQVIAFVKSKDLLRYIPDNMLSSEQKNVKWEAIAETIKTTNKKNDKKYSEFIANENLRAANEMVAQAAKANGYTLKAYHGGNHFFTVFGKGNKTSSAPDGAYFFTDNMDVAYSYTAYKNIVDLNVNNHPIYKQATPDGRIEENRVSHGGVYPVYLKLQNPYIVDFEGRHWGNKVNGMDINEIAVWAKENGYDGVIAKNIIDAGDMGDVNYEEGNTRVPSTDYIIFDSARAKSSETITYDDEGNIIPISERFNQENDDIRFSEKDYGTSAYDVLGEAERLRKENAKLDADAIKFKEILGNEEIPNKRFLALANYLKKTSGSNMDSVELARRLKDAYTSMQTSKELKWEDVAMRTFDIAESLMGNDLGVPVEYFKNVMYEIRKDKISLTEEQRVWAEKRFGGYGNFHKYVFGRANIVKEGTSLEDAWKTWAEKHPSLFDSDVHGEAQVEAFVELVDAIKETSSIMGEYERSEAIRHLSTEVYNQFWNIATDNVTDSKVKTKRAQHRALMENLKKDYEKRQKDLAVHPVGETALKYEGILTKIRDSKRKEISKAKQLGRERLAQYRENAERKTKIQSITSNALTLNKWLVTNSKDAHVHEALKAPVINLLNAIDFSSKRMLDKGIPTQKDISLAKALGKVQKMMTSASNGNVDLVQLYGHGLDEEIETMMNSIEAMDRTIADNEYILQEMSLNDLVTLDKIVRTIKHSVSKLNKFHIVNHAKGIANLSRESIEEVDSLGKGKVYDGLRGKVDKTLMWNNALPVYAFKRYGEGGQKIFEAIQDGWDTFAFNVKQSLDYANKTYTSKEVNEWEKEVKTFKILVPATELDLANPDYKPQYQRIQMTIPQIMSLYCLQKREQAVGHILGGGIRVADFTIEKKLGNEVVSQTEGAVLTEKDIETIISSLTSRQKTVADSLQKFMNTVCSDWGNEVSMARFGIKQFGEENYFPIESDDNNIGKEPNDAETSLFRLLNMSFSKALTEGANNRIVISNIFDVFAQHSSDMAKYNALALPVLDAFRWYNYTEKQEVGDGKPFITKGVKQSMENAFGKDGQNYFTTFLKDINGQKEVSRDTVGSGFFKNAKVAAVGANLRVVALQPTSYVRASAVIDNKYLTMALGHKPKIKYAEKYCGIALWKSMGYYDTNIQRGVAEQIKHNETWKDKATEWSMKGAEMADKITWGYLWNACELEVRDKRKDLKVGSEEFYTAIAKRLREVIYATQVVDSTMTRSQMMRSTQFYDKMLTSFASEPTLAYNMLLDAYMDCSLDARKMGKKEALKKNGKRMARIFAAYTMTNAVAAFVEAAFDAYRDDDEEEKDLAYFAKLYFENFFNDMSITAKIPYIKEFHSVIKGFSTSRTDTQWMESIFKAMSRWWKIFTTDKGNTAQAVKDSLKAISYMSGLPFYNLYRDTKLEKLIAELFEG